jgi:hypothetical protein
MNLRNLLLLGALLALLFALGLLLGPTTILTVFGLGTGPGENLVAQLLGATLVVPALIGWFARDVADPGSRAAVVVPLFLWSVIGFVISLLGVLSKALKLSGWGIVVLFLFFALGYGYFQFFRSTD